MSATAALSKKPPRAKVKSPSDSRRADANRRNAQKSTGPRTPEGKDRSRHNAVTHGETARSGLLPGENADEFAALQQLMVGRFKPCNDTELTMVERIAIDIWTSDRAAQAAGKRLAERLRREPLERSENERDEALALGGRLLWQPAFPLPISKRFQIGELTEPPCSDNAIHPHHPARLCLRLEQTVAGCDWLLDRWGELSERLHSHDLWLSSDAFHMVRLMGKHAVNMADDLDVAGVFLASLTLLVAPKCELERKSFDWKHAMIRMLMTFDAEQDHGDPASVAKHCEPFARRLAELPLARMVPKGDEPARQWLTARIRRELERIRGIRATLREIADADRAEAPARLAFETGHEGEKHRRYMLANERVLNRHFGLFLSTRKMSEAGAIRDSSGAGDRFSVGGLDPVDRPHLDPGKSIDGWERFGRDATINPGQSAMPDEPDKTDTPCLPDEPAAVRSTVEPACGDRPETTMTDDPATDREPPAGEPIGDIVRKDDGGTTVVSHYEVAICDTDPVLRNEPNAAPAEAGPAEIGQRKPPLAVDRTGRENGPWRDPITRFARDGDRVVRAVTTRPRSRGKTDP